ncbi:MAG: uroporphyrinogen-III C-methyltransferase [Sedimenticolaceae bacterium]
MNDDDPKPGVVIDVTPEHEGAGPDETPSPPSGDKPPVGGPARGNPLPLILAILALISVAVAGGLGYQSWSELKADLASMDVRLLEAQSRQQQLQQSLSSASETLSAQEGALGEQRDVLAQQRIAMDEARAAFREQEQKLADENLRMQEREAELRAAVADVHRRVGRSGTQWMVAEADYLLRIANDRLILARDTGTARSALQLADQRLRDTGDPGWAGVREQIARDIALLSTIEVLDRAGLAAGLSALIGQVPQLKIASTTIGAQRTLPEATGHQAGERSWKTLAEDLWAGFKDSVRIRERDEPIQAMLAPEHQFFLYENLKLLLEGARFALARDDQTMFQDSLVTAADWLTSYFDPNDGTTASMKQAIDSMRQIDIRPVIPDISQSLRALQVRQQLMIDVVPSGIEAQ